jgi:hypothetical protein
MGNLTISSGSLLSALNTSMPATTVTQHTNIKDLAKIKLDKLKYLHGF